MFEYEFDIANLNIDRTKPKIELLEITNSSAKNKEIANKDDIVKVKIKITDKNLKATIKQLRDSNIELEKDVEEKSKIDEMRKQFISDVSHELKTPIALIQGYAEGLIENVNVDDEIVKDSSIKIYKLENISDGEIYQIELKKIEGNGFLKLNILEGAVIDKGELKSELLEIDTNILIENDKDFNEKIIDKTY